jgi:hypothetical protein
MSSVPTHTLFLPVCRTTGVPRLGFTQPHEREHMQHYSWHHYYFVHNHVVWVRTTWNHSRCEWLPNVGTHISTSGHPQTDRQTDRQTEDSTSTGENEPCLHDDETTNPHATNKNITTTTTTTTTIIYKMIIIIKSSKTILLFLGVLGCGGLYDSFFSTKQWTGWWASSFVPSYETNCSTLLEEVEE